ncbi:MAG: glutathione S-transferase N-terminal domain-containing protein [Patescibacteria group bacterium]
MITLFVKMTCPYSLKVLKVVEGLQVPVTLKNIADAGVADELITLGGKRQVPYMVDDERGIFMYESNDIVSHLCQHFDGDPAEFGGDVPMHVCPID